MIRKPMKPIVDKMSGQPPFSKLFNHTRKESNSISFGPRVRFFIIYFRDYFFSDTRYCTDSLNRVVRISRSSSVKVTFLRAMALEAVCNALVS